MNILQIPRRSKPRCTFAFFGIDRRLDLTGPSIMDKIIIPAQKSLYVKNVGFLWAPTQITNPRSGESASLVSPRFECLPPGNYISSEVPDLESDEIFKRLTSYGDFWNDGYYSLRNLYLQLKSLSKVTDMVLETNPDFVVFLRPDLLYHDSFSSIFKWVATANKTQVLLPHWQPHKGLNDRFALCLGAEAIRAYGNRLETAIEFCEKTNQSLHSEQLVHYSLRGVPIKRISNRASRMRVDGLTKSEDFSWRGWKPACRVLLGAVNQYIFSREKNR